MTQTMQDILKGVVEQNQPSWAQVVSTMDRKAKKGRGGCRFQFLHLKDAHHIAQSIKEMDRDGSLLVQYWRGESFYYISVKWIYSNREQLNPTRSWVPQDNLL